MTDDLGPDRLEGLTCASLVDAMARRYAHRCHILGLTSPTPGRRLWGPAATVELVPAREDVKDPVHHNFARLFYEAVGDAPAGKVLVVAGRGHDDVALGGGAKLARVAARGLAGVLADGPLRDWDELAAHGFATWSRGQTVQASGSTLMPLAANVPLVIGRVTVLPGDYVYADASGACVVPARDVGAVLEAAHTLETKDTATRDAILAEDPTHVRKHGAPK